MKRLFFKIIVLAGFLSLLACSSSTDPAKWSQEKIDKWFEKGEWLNGWNVTPDPSINKKEFVISYFKNKERWDKAFAFLKNNDLATLALKRYDIDDNNLYATVSEYTTKNEENANFEAHKKYIDIQYVINGKEIINIAPLSTLKEVITPYDEAKDIEFLTVDKVVNYKADPGRFFIFFPDDAHRPGIKDGENSQVRKIVIKLKVD